jgi:hypothetical protein
MYQKLVNKLLPEWSLPAQILASIAAICFSLSLVLTSLHTSGEDLQGFWVLLTGWLGFIIFQFSWFANPLTLLALLILDKKPWTSLVLSSLAIVLATQAYFFTEIPTGLNQEITFIQEVGLGFYFWYLAQVLFFCAICGQLLQALIKKQDDKNYAVILPSNSPSPINDRF